MWYFQLNSFFVSIYNFGREIRESREKWVVLYLRNGVACTPRVYKYRRIYVCTESYNGVHEPRAKSVNFYEEGRDLKERKRQEKGKTPIKTGTNCAIESPTISRDTGLRWGEGGAVAFMACVCDIRMVVRSGRAFIDRLFKRAHLDLWFFWKCKKCFLLLLKIVFK